MSVARGQVYWATDEGRRRPFVVVSNNVRNRALGSCLAARMTTQPKPRLATVVELGDTDEPARGRVLCDDLLELRPREHAMELMAALSPATMSRVDAGLRVALGLR